MADGSTFTGAPTVLTDGAGFGAVIFDTRDPAQREALHRLWAPTEAQRAEWRVRGLRDRLGRVCRQFGLQHAMARTIPDTIPDTAPDFIKAQYAEIKQELGQ